MKKLIIFGFLLIWVINLYSQTILVTDAWGYCPESVDDRKSEYVEWQSLEIPITFNPNSIIIHGETQIFITIKSEGIIIPSNDDTSTMVWLDCDLMIDGNPRYDYVGLRITKSDRYIRLYVDFKHFGYVYLIKQ